MNTKVDSCTLTCFDDFIIKLLLNFCDNFLNACRVNTSVCYQLMKCQAANLTANWVESRNNDCFWRIIYNDFYSCCSLQSTDITTFTTNDATFYLIAINMENTYRVLYSCFCCNSLYSLNNYLLCLLVRIKFGFINYFVDIRSCIQLRLILQALNQTLLCVFRAKSRKLF